MISTPPIRLTNIQALRGVAALFVLVFHIFEWHRLAQIGNVSSGTFPNFMSKGFLGVDLFFVISGFIIVYVTRAKGEGVRTAKAFLISRATRIYPLWWFYAGLMALYFWAAYGLPVDMARLEDGQGIVSYLLKSFLLFPQEGAPVLGLGWSLIHEMYFYVVFAVILLLPKKYLGLSLTVWGVCVILGASLGLAKPVATGFVTLIFSPLTLEFLAGACVGLFVCQGFYKYAKIAGCLGIIVFLVLISPWAGNLDNTLPYGRVILFTIPLSLWVYSGAVLDLTRGYKPPKSLVSIGDWSYSLYLSHVLVLSAVKRSLEKFGVGFQNVGPWDEGVFFALCLGLAVLVAALSYRYIERPLIRYFRT